MRIPSKKIPSLSSMRRLAIGAWRAPNDPSVQVQLNIDMTPLYDHAGDAFKKNLKLFLVKLMATILNDIPELNTMIIGRTCRQRTNNRIFIPTIFRHSGMVDLNGFFIDDAHTMTISQLRTLWSEKLAQLRNGQDAPIMRVIRLLNCMPRWMDAPFVWLANQLQFNLNIPMNWLGLPQDRFGSLTITFLDKFNIKYADVPLFPMARSPMLLAVGTPYRDQHRTHVPITCTFDHRCFDGQLLSRAHRRIQRLLASPQTWATI